MVKHKKCLTCGTAFKFCPDCSGVDRLLPAYRATFCSEECATLWSTATKFNMGKLDKAEAKEIISNLNLKPKEEYVACVQRDLENILKPKRGKRIEVKPLDVVEEVKPVEEVSQVEETKPVDEIKTEEATLEHEVVIK